MGDIRDILAYFRGKLFIYKIKLFNKNVQIGDGLKLYCKLGIRGKGRIKIGKNCIVKGIPGSRNQYVTLNTTSPEADIVIGDNVQLVSIKTSCNYSMTIGNNVIIEDSSLLDSAFHALGEQDDRPLNETRENSAIKIHDNVQIGVRSIIMKGVSIGEWSIVAPCSVVQKSFPEHSFLIGNPAERNENEIG